MRWTAAACAGPDPAACARAPNARRSPPRPHLLQRQRVIHHVHHLQRPAAHTGHTAAPSAGQPWAGRATRAMQPWKARVRRSAAGKPLHRRRPSDRAAAPHARAGFRRQPRRPHRIMDASTSGPLRLCICSRYASNRPRSSRTCEGPSHARAQSSQSAPTHKRPLTHHQPSPDVLWGALQPALPALNLVPTRASTPAAC
jgi:hypothetical protein